MEGDVVKVFGCGNIIMGDDGYGPAVVERLHANYDIPDSVEAVDVGTSVREYLFDYLLSEEDRPEQIIIVDAVDFSEKEPGDVFEIIPGQIPAKKIHDFSLHQFPTVNLLHELAENTGIQVMILAAQVSYIPDQITSGLSPAMVHGVEKACEKISQFLSLKAK